MRNIRPIDVLFPKTRQGILAALFLQPEKPWFTSELARRMGVPSSSLQRELSDLTAAGLLKTHRQGRMAYYQANVDAPIFSDLHGLMLKTAGLLDVLNDTLSSLVKKIRVAFVYGSFASGDEESQSDIDLMVVGSVSPAELALPLRKASELLCREINPTVYSPAEFAKKRRGKDHFLSRVLDKPTLFVLGSKHELDKLAEK